jgi:hypothetical protein
MMIGAFASRAASRAATTVDEDVQFCYILESMGRDKAYIDTYNSWDSEVVLLGVVEELQDIIANNNTGLAG